MWTKITEDKATWPPLDGTSVLLCDEDGTVTLGVCETDGGHLVCWMFDEDGGTLEYVGDGATHWMPLPQPPTE